MDGSRSSRGGRARSSPCAPPGSSLEPAGQKIPFHRQLADLGVKIANLGLAILPLAVRPVRKHLAQAVDRLALPAAHLVRMHLVLRGDLLARRAAAHCLQGNSGLELPRKPTSRRHLVSLRYPVEYTLAPCPVFRDQLSGRGEIIHEIGHVLGLDHEQNRKDRDQYVRVNINNITEGYAYAFEQRPSE